MNEKSEKKGLNMKLYQTKLDENKFKDLIIISNLPYNISTKVILYLFTFNKNILEILKWHLRPTKDKNKYIRACTNLSLKKSNAAIFGMIAAGTMLRKNTISKLKKNINL